MGDVGVTIRIEGAESATLDKVVDDLKLHGLRNVQVHQRFQIINGDIEPQNIDVLRAVGGVLSIREDRTYNAD